MTIRLMFHLEAVEDRTCVWWIDSPDVPGFYATAEQIVECRRRALEALEDLEVDTSQIVERLVAPAELEPTPSRTPAAAFDDSPRDVTEGDRITIVRTRLAVA